RPPWPERCPVRFDTALFAHLPPEVALRLLSRAISHTGDEGPVELAKLESLYEEMRQTASRLRRTLAGALVTLDSDWIAVERAPGRRVWRGCPAPRPPPGPPQNRPKRASQNSKKKHTRPGSLGASPF